MQYSQEHLKTMVYAKFGGANRVFYGELENREFSIYCTFHKHAKFTSQPMIAFFAAVNHLILMDLLGNKTLLNEFKRSWFAICGFRSVLCFSVSRFVACDRNYD